MLRDVLLLLFRAWIKISPKVALVALKHFKKTEGLFIITGDGHWTLP
jgi:hypothetical protein